MVLAHRLQWRPVAGVPSGVAWLAAQGFDAGLLDDVRPISALATWSELREADAFYGVLAALARGNVDALRELAAAEVRAAVDRWRERAAEAHARLGAAEATDAAGAAVRREQQIAAAVAERARRGVSSVMPLYFDPAS